MVLVVAVMLAGTVSAETSVSDPVNVVGVSISSVNANMLMEMDKTLKSVASQADTDQLLSLIGESMSNDKTQLMNVGKNELAAWQNALRKSAVKLDLRVIKLADKGTVTTNDVQNIRDQYKKYRNLKAEANERLSFFELNIPDNRWEAEYEKFEDVYLFLNADDKNQNIRRFFIKKTGKDVLVQKGTAFNIWMGAISSVVTWFVIVAL